MNSSYARLSTVGEMQSFTFFKIKPGIVFPQFEIEEFQDALEAKAHARLMLSNPEYKAIEIWDGEAATRVTPEQPSRLQPPMGYRPTTAERAFQLAESGECETIAQIAVRMQAEGYEHVHGHLSGTSMTGPLRRAIALAKKIGDGASVGLD